MAMGSINLIKTRTNASPQLEHLELMLKKLSIGGFIALIVSGIAAGSVFFYLQHQKETLSGTKTALNQSIRRNSTKEGLVVAIGGRILIVDKIVGSQRPMGVLFDRLAAVASPSQFSSLSFDDHSKTELTIRVKSIDDVVAIVDVLLKETQEKHIESPQLLSLTLARDGSIEFSVAFTAHL